MPAPIEFFFDFSSPYGYIASRRIDDLGARHGRAVIWRPILLGAVFKLTGMTPLTEIPMKGDYAKHDFARTARLHGLPFAMPEPFPFSGLSAKRCTTPRFPATPSAGPRRWRISPPGWDWTGRPC